MRAQHPGELRAPKIGELFAGYGGLGMGVQAVYGGEIAWVSEFDKGPSKILAHRFPGVPNHGDITKIKWTPDCPACGSLLALYDKPDASEERGYYCPTDGWFPLDLWKSEPGIPEPVDILTGGSPCQDLSHAGRRAGMTEGTRSNLWVAMREAVAQIRPAMVVWENVGGAFSAAADSEVEPCPGCVGDGTGVHLRALGRILGDLSSLGYDASWHALRASDVGAPHGRLRVFVTAADAPCDARWIKHRDCAPTAVPKGSRGQSPWSHLDESRRTDALRPTPTTAPATGNGHARNLGAEARRWGEYADTINRWEDLTRPAPEPTTQGRTGPQLSPRFVEWMMGLPEGWVTDVPGITRTEALKALGNGVCPQQAAAALQIMASWLQAAA